MKNFKLWQPIAFVIFLSIGTTGCTSLSMLSGNSYKFDFALLNKDSITGRIDTLYPMQFEDEKISIAFSIGATSINFNIKNKTDQAVRIIWDDMSIVQNGEAHKIMHAGVKYTDRNNSQPPTLIPPQASIEDLVLPTDNVYYQDGYYSTYSSSPGSWKERDLFARNDYNKPEFTNAILDSKGKGLSLYFPLKSQDKSIDYTFNFIITSVQAVGAQ